MVGSGLRQVLELLYSGNAVDHIMSGEAVSRPVRVHTLIDAVLSAILLSTAYSCDIHINIEIEELEASIAHPDLEEIQKLLTSAIKEENCLENIILSLVVEKVSACKHCKRTARRKYTYCQVVVAVYIYDGCFEIIYESKTNE